jgi:hypothetical protein
MRHRLAPWCLLLWVPVLSGCIVRDTGVVRVPAGPPPLAVVVRTPPPTPPPQVEVITSQPGPAHVWVPGHWAWRGPDHGYVWLPGHWAIPQTPHHVWLPGHWAPQAGGSVWVEGQWRPR